MLWQPQRRTRTRGTTKVRAHFSSGRRWMLRNAGDCWLSSIGWTQGRNRANEDPSMRIAQLSRNGIGRVVEQVPTLQRLHEEEVQRGDVEADRQWSHLPLAQ